MPAPRAGVRCQTAITHTVNVPLQRSRPRSLFSSDFSSVVTKYVIKVHSAEPEP